MNIYAKKGDKVIFDSPNNGHKFDQVQAERFLKIGETYTIESTSVDSFRTEIYLQEFPGHYFNCVHFSDVEA